MAGLFVAVPAHSRLGWKILSSKLAKASKANTQTSDFEIFNKIVPFILEYKLLHLLYALQIHFPHFVTYPFILILKALGFRTFYEK